MLHNFIYQPRFTPKARLFTRIFCVAASVFVGIFVLNFESISAETPTVTPSPSVNPTASVSPTSTSGVNPEKKNELESKIVEYQNKIKELQGEAKTLKSQISLVDNQIAVAELRVKDTEEKIEQLERDIEIAEKKINGLETNIETVSKVMVERVGAVYAVGTIDPIQMLLTSDNISNFLTRLKYLKVVQLYDKRQIYAAEQAKISYEQEQSLFESKQEEAEALKSQLASFNEQLESEKNKKKQLLEATNNDEKNYQNLLASARAEYDSIQGIIAGKGSETEVGHVNEGEKIASVISGASCNSSGTHLHFIVQENGSTRNPFSYLSSADHSNNTGGDEFNPSGSWNWPIEPKIQYNQGYGETWAVRNTWVGQVYRFHNGIDISGSSLTVRAVKSGTLYQGSYGGSGGCRLRYVKVKHDEGGIDTLYLHINY